MPRSQRAFSLTADTITLEGNLITAAMLASVAAQGAGEQSDADYKIPKGLTLRDEIARYFRIGQALFAELRANPAPSAARTINFAEALFRDVLGFSDVTRVGTRTLNGRVFAVTLEALNGRVPIVVVPPSDSLDRATDNLPADGHRRSAASAIQEWLNASDDGLWGFCSNGEHLRLLRYNQSLTRPAFIEADLRQMFDTESFADFTVLWLLTHASRFGLSNTPLTDCVLERWREMGAREGMVARDRLRDGVEAALKLLGSGFLTANPDLRRRVQSSELPLTDFFGQLLRLVYRMIFLLVAEDRGLLHPPDAAPAWRLLYTQGYSLAFLRERAIRRTAWDAHHDKWEGLSIVFKSLAHGENRLALPALGGLFAPEMTPDLDSACLPNRALMEAVFRLAWLREEVGLVPVNWRDMETEELGSVYESLLELTPRLVEDGRGFAFAEGDETKGHARKTTGSYYTPDSLVQLLLDSALDPVLDRVETESGDAATGLLSLTVLDPACGSGHFLLAAARRIATRLARARAGGVASAEDFRHALRDVVRSSIYGVDRNPMAVELTKVALWIETVEPGKPLGFLDANIRCGDSLLGIFDTKTLEAGIPNAAYKPLTGDDKTTAKYYAARNREEASDQGNLDFARGRARLPAAPLAKEWSSLGALPEDSPEQVTERRRRFEAARTDRLRRALGKAADLYVTAFLIPKTGPPPASGDEPALPTTSDVWLVLGDKEVHRTLVERATELARQARVFHWPLEFPYIMAARGFDVVVGNPPWEVMQLSEEEYFAQSLSEVAELAGAARKHAIAALATERPSIFAEYQEDKRRFEAANEFARASGRFNLTARGKINTYGLFAEHFSNLVSPRGRAGMIVPTGLITDYTKSSFFASLSTNRRLIRSIAFDNQKKIFPGIHPDTPFTLLTIGSESQNPEFAAYILEVAHLANPERRYRLSSEDIARINPNTRTAPMFRARADAELTAKIYGNVPVLIDEAKGLAGNPWGVEFRQGLFNMTSDSGLFKTEAQLRESGFSFYRGVWTCGAARYLPLYEAKMIHQLDHRWATYDGADSRDTTEAEKRDPDFEPTPRYWVPVGEVMNRLAAKGWTRSWLMGWRDITNATNERTVIATAFPRMGVGNKIPLILPGAAIAPEQATALIGNLAALALDFAARQKVGGTTLNFFILFQLPILPPSTYSEADLAFIVPRVLELTYTSHSIAPFAHDLGYEGPPFSWNEDRRALLRAELDAWYARAYGLWRDELRYILDPEDAMGPGYPSETFRVLKNNEIRRFGEYRTARLVLEAWDRMERSSKVDL